MPDSPPIERSRLAWCCLAVVLVVGGPLCVAMPLPSDAAMYDVQARIVAEGGVLYRDALEPNLPGAPWVHGVVRGLFGWGSETLRLFDLAVFAGIVMLLAGLVRRVSGSTTTAVWASVALFVAYFSLSEWCHCQRDVWMLLPALAAVHLRIAQQRRLVDGESTWAVLGFGFGFVEGSCWAAAFWLKPHVAVPAAACLVVTAVLSRRWRRVAVDVAGVLCGGLVVGGAGIAWLSGTGAWPWFWETMTQWNPEYLAIGRSRWTWSRIAAVVDRLQPWMLLHLVAVPAAVGSLLEVLNWAGKGDRHQCVRGACSRGRTSRRDALVPDPAPGGVARPGSGSDSSMVDVQSLPAASATNRCLTPLPTPTSTPRLLLATLYLAWFAQAALLQHAFDYVQTPPLLLAIPVLATVRLDRASRPLGRLAVGAFTVLVVLTSPLFRFERLAVWPRAVSEGSTPEVRDRLGIVRFVGWREMAAVDRFLTSRGERSGVLFYNVYLVHFHAEGRFVPPTRFVYLQPSVRCFASRHGAIRRAIDASGARYVVTSMAESGLLLAEALAVDPLNPAGPPPAYAPPADAFPWQYPVVFRAGRYLVHRIDAPAGRLGVELGPLDGTSSPAARPAPSVDSPPALATADR